MNNFAVLLFCVQACLIQNAFSQCFGSYAPAATFAPVLTPDFPYPGAFANGYPTCTGGYDFGAYDSESYGGAGEGNVAVAGELLVAGKTSVAGKIPILGAVRFGGEVPAAGVVTITGKCTCGCGGPYLY